MTIDLLIHAIVRQTTILIAQLATSGGTRAPLAQVANQVFLDLVGELERQGVSRKVSADMFGLGLRTYQRKIQRMSESSTERGRSLWEVVLDYVRSKSMVTRADILTRFVGEEEAQVRAVLHDLCESRLVFSSGLGSSAVYRAASDDELGALRQMHGAEGIEELLWALIYQDGPIGSEEVVQRFPIDKVELDDILKRLEASGRIERIDDGGKPVYRARTLVIPLGSSVGWEAAVFDHFKAVVNTIICRLRDDRTAPGFADRVGGSTYTVEIWKGHPLAAEAEGTLRALRSMLGDLRERIDRFNGEHGIPEGHTRVVLYAGQCLIGEGNEEEPAER